MNSTINQLSSLGRPPKTMAAYLSQAAQWRKTAFVLALVLMIMPKALQAKIDPEQWWLFTDVSHSETAEEPWLGIDIVIYDKDDGDAFFLHNTVSAGAPGPAIYIDDHYICSPDWELAWPGSGSGSGSYLNTSIQEYKGGWWGNTYTKTINGVDYTIKFKNPRWDGQQAKVTLCLYRSLIQCNQKTQFKLRGSWRRKNKDSWTEIKWFTTGGIESPFDVQGKRTAWQKCNISSSLSFLSDMVSDYKIGIWVDQPENSVDLGFSPGYGHTPLLSKTAPTGMLSCDFSNINCSETEYWAPRTPFTAQSQYTIYTDGMPITVWANSCGYLTERPSPDITSARFDMWNKKIDLEWKDLSEVASESKGTISIYYYPKNQDNKRQLAVENLLYTTTSYPFKVPDYDQEYTFEIVYIPEGAPSNKYLYKSSSTVSSATNRHFVVKMESCKPTDRSIDLQWSSEQYLGSEKLEFDIFRQSSEEDTWKKIASKIIDDKKRTLYTYKDDNIASACTSYRYKVKCSLLEGFDSESDTTSFVQPTGKSKVTSLTASKGDFQGVVKLSWTAEQVDSTPTSFEVLRKSKGLDNWATITKVSGTSKNYYYEDNTAQPGQYYDYRVISTTPCDSIESVLEANDEGFCRSTGIISGRISYGTGTAVSDARVSLVRNNESQKDKSQFYSIRTQDPGSGVFLDLDSTTINNKFSHQPFSVQLYVCPDKKQEGASPVIFDLGGQLSLRLGQLADSVFPLILARENKADTTAIRLAADAFTSVTLTMAPGGVINLTAIDSVDTMAVQILINEDLVFTDNTQHGLCFGGSYHRSVDNQFCGYVDEMRVFTGKALSKEEIKKNYNHMLAGTEDNLFLYWPVDEGISDQKIAYDYSKTSGVANGNHGRLGFMTKPTNEKVPTADQLGLFAYTDSQGNFVVRGVPFDGDGTNYMVVPTKGIHEFSPAYSSRYVSASSLVHSGVNFTDVSSFPVKGTVYYKDTEYPVAGCNLYVDGEICSKDGQIITTSATGEFTISVPIGDHFIEVRKDGHVFANNGRYPEDPNETGERHTFIESMSNLTFYDSTLVNFSGRVVGGSIEGDKPLGFGESVNNIGVAEIVLKQESTKYCLNGGYVNDGTVVKWKANDDILTCPSGTNKVNSRSWRGAAAASQEIYIHTDPLTGEFSAMVPPLLYKVDIISVLSSGLEIKYNNKIDLSNPRLMYSDSIKTDEGEMLKYEYNYALKQTYHSPATFKVTDRGNKDGAFGLSSYEGKDEQGDFAINDIYTVDSDNTVNYKYGGAIFVSQDKYTFDIEAYEEYINKDNGATSMPYRVPLANTDVIISNALSAEQHVYIEGNPDNKEPGTIAKMTDNTLTLDSLGKATYIWKAGLPNITPPYYRTISMTYDIDGRANSWEGSGLKGIILGSLPTGSNFVTAGPDIVEMILRDPPGSLSSAQWTSGTITSRSTSSGRVWDSQNDAVTETNIGPEVKTSVGFGVAAITEMKTIATVDAGVTVRTEGESASTWSTSTTATRTISTSDSPDYVGHNGDVFIGTATNLVYGLARDLNFRRKVDNSKLFELGPKDIYTTGLDFKTTFNYTVNYIENTLLPNLEAIRNRLLITVGSIESQSKPEGKNPIYVTTLQHDDPRFGSYNHDKAIWNAEAKQGMNGPSYWVIAPDNIEVRTDSVAWCNNQIEIWKGWLRKNEQEKVDAHNNYATSLLQNLSFDAGTSINATTQTDSIKGSTYECTVVGQAIMGVTGGITFNKVGVIGTIKTTTGGGTHDTSSKEDTKSTAFSYTLAESGSDDALSVDIYQYGDYSPIFRTVAGQTSDPYEGEVTTKYLDTVEVIMEATMQIEVPKIDVDVPLVTNVASGSAANYTLRLSNASEIDTDVYYKLFQIDDNNENGALLTIDGLPLSMNRLIKIPAGQTVTKALQLRQTDMSQLDYKNLGIVLASQTQWDPTGVWDQIADTVYVSAQFVPSSSPVVMSLDKTTINTKTGTDLNISFSDFDRNFKNLKAFRLQYSKQGDAGWTQLHEYVLNAEEPMQNRELLPNDATVTYKFPMKDYSDGTYRFRIQSASRYGMEEVYRYSNEIAVVKDTECPQPLGQPMPTNGILGTGDDLGITFNEPILKGQLTKTANFLVTGVLNGATIEHETALELRPNTVAASTEAPVTLCDHDFSIDTWLYLDSSGTFLSHGNATTKLELAITPQQQMAVKIGNNTYTSVNTLPTGKWIYLTMSYTSGTQPLLNAAFATDGNDPVQLFKNFPVAAYKGQGELTVGNGATGAIHELTLWDEAHDITTALLDKSKTKYPATPHLIGYWKLNEGQGTTATDYARNRHMYLTAETWKLDNENLAIRLDGSSHLDMLTADVAPLAYDNSAMELWMRADKQEGNVQLLQSGEVELWIDSVGKLQLTTLGNNYTITNGSLLDNVWHHIALNILRTGHASVYVDGKQQFTTSASNIGQTASDRLIIGARRSRETETTFAYDRFYKGFIDEVRLWNATLTADLIRARAKMRLTGEEEGLVAYYPFEKKTLNDNLQVITKGTEEDMKNSANKATYESGKGLVFVKNAPALRKAPTETNVDFSFTASDDKVIITINETPAKIEGCTLNFTVHGVRDLNGNASDPVCWSAYINRKELTWDKSAIELRKRVDETTDFETSFTNKGGNLQTWSISGLPQWLKVDMEDGSADPLSETTVTFTVSPGTPIGSYEETVYLTGNDDIASPLTIRLIVTGDIPAWSVDPSAYESTMNLIATLSILGEPSNDTEDLVAAFIDGECRGVAHPVYNARYDSYFVMLDIYGDEDETSSPVTFYAYDSSTGISYPELSSTQAISFKANQVLGTYATPIDLNAENRIEQNLHFNKGWNWSSFFVHTDDMNVGRFFEPVAEQTEVVKGKTAFAKFENSICKGKLFDLDNCSMYKVRMTQPATLRVVGTRPTEAQRSIEVHPEWNWIAYSGTRTASVADALAGLDPMNGDLIKGQQGFAMFDGYEWNGSLKALVPGQGYMFKSVAPAERTLDYPIQTAPYTVAPLAISTLRTFTPTDHHKYPGNMCLVAYITWDGMPASVKEVGIFAGEECRTAEVVDNEGYAYFTIPGDEQQALRFLMEQDGKVYVSDATITYEEDAIIGSHSAPFSVPFLSESGAYIDAKHASSDGEEQWFTLSGQRLDGKPIIKGVYVCRKYNKETKSITTQNVTIK